MTYDTTSGIKNKETVGVNIHNYGKPRYVAWCGSLGFWLGGFFVDMDFTRYINLLIHLLTYEVSRYQVVTTRVGDSADRY